MRVLKLPKVYEHSAPHLFCLLWLLEVWLSSKSYVKFMLYVYSCGRFVVTLLASLTLDLNIGGSLPSSPNTLIRLVGDGSVGHSGNYYIIV